MKLKPVDKPKSILLKIAYFLSKREFGKVIAPLRYIYARSTPIMMASYKIITTENKLRLPKEIKILIRYYTAHLNECTFCSNAQEFGAAKEKLKIQKLKELFNFRESTNFTPKEKSLLLYLEEVNLTKTASEQTFENLRSYFNETEIVKITWINATENYFNLMAKPLRLTSDELKFPSSKKIKT
ncbi:hypothetical protein AHMF7605_02745 [Adhaeribacter arboris]|uniref:Carboxymuconolactone decarboxylase family protein n=1 Tax=Adhaeribacter arboris TaxID=2072846 RepID=A0A2T2YAH8_9BACT|nr:hypothetical protein [Adhaeribacter arboris]PSR52517.1 hypothetical protein AHMF7605_02745 [Adhaeribacter arboris]